MSNAWICDSRLRGRISAKQSQAVVIRSGESPCSHLKFPCACFKERIQTEKKKKV